MTIRELKKEIEKIKNKVKRDPNAAIAIFYKGKLRDEENNICIDSIIAIDGYDVSTISKEEIRAVIDRAKVRYLFPDNGRDPRRWKPWNPGHF
jgi:hypothetical protein